MRLFASLLLLAGALEARKVPHKSRWAAKQERIANPKVKEEAKEPEAPEAPEGAPPKIQARSFAVASSSSGGKSGWTPCTTDGVDTEKPDKPQTNFNKCLANAGFGYDVIRCVNWERNGGMDGSNEKCENACHDVFNSHASLSEAKFRCSTSKKGK